MDGSGGHREAEQGNDDGRRGSIRRYCEEGNRVKLQPENRRRRDTAGSRDRDRLTQRLRQRVALEPLLESRREREDRDDRRERKLETGVEKHVGVPREQRERTE